MTVTEILARANSGEIQIKQEGEFTFVNIGSGHMESSDTADRLTPPTFSIVTDDEARALHEPIDYNIVRGIVGQTRKRPLAA